MSFYHALCARCNKVHSPFFIIRPAHDTRADCRMGPLTRARPNRKFYPRWRGDTATGEVERRKKDGILSETPRDVAVKYLTALYVIPNRPHRVRLGTGPPSLRMRIIDFHRRKCPTESRPCRITDPFVAATNPRCCYYSLLIYRQRHKPLKLSL